MTIYVCLTDDAKDLVKKQSSTKSSPLRDLTNRLSFSPRMYKPLSPSLSVKVCSLGEELSPKECAGVETVAIVDTRLTNNLQTLNVETFAQDLHKTLGNIQGPVNLDLFASDLHFRSDKPTLRDFGEQVANKLLKLNQNITSITVRTPVDVSRLDNATHLKYNAKKNQWSIEGMGGKEPQVHWQGRFQALEDQLVEVRNDFGPSNAW